MEINKPMGEKVAWLLQPGVCDWDPAGLGSNDHFLHPQAIHGVTEKEQAHWCWGVAWGIGWESASVSSGFKTRGSLIHIAAGKLVPGSHLLGKGPRWGGGTLHGRKAGKHHRTTTEKGELGVQNHECGEVWVWAPQQQSWRRRFGHMQVLWERRGVRQWYRVGRGYTGRGCTSRGVSPAGPGDWDTVCITAEGGLLTCQLPSVSKGCLES